MIDLDLAKVFGERILKILTTDMKDAWELLPPDEKKLAQAVAMDSAELMALGLVGKAAAEEEQEVRAQRASLASAGAEVARRALAQFAKDASLEIARGALAVGAMVV